MASRIAAVGLVMVSERKSMTAFSSMATGPPGGRYGLSNGRCELMRGDTIQRRIVRIQQADAGPPALLFAARRWSRFDGAATFTCGAGGAPDGRRDLFARSRQRPARASDGPCRAQDAEPGPRSLHWRTRTAHVSLFLGHREPGKRPDPGSLSDAVICQR